MENPHFLLRFKYKNPITQIISLHHCGIVRYNFSSTSNFCIVNFVSNTKMAAAVKFICVLGFLAVFSIAMIERADGASACGKASPDDEAIKLAPCADAAQDEKAAVSASCCQQVKRMGQNPSCLCAILLSDTAKSSGVKLEVAITIPKRCNLANRPVGYKCGGYTLP